MTTVGVADDTKSDSSGGATIAGGGFGGCGIGLGVGLPAVHKM
jgi:hypothetical protein